MWTQAVRRALVALLLVGLATGCKRDKPTEPPNDDEPTPTEDVRRAR